MSAEYTALKGKPLPVKICPECLKEPKEYFNRGNVQNGFRKFFRRPYCAIICEHCMEIIGWEKP